MGNRGPGDQTANTQADLGLSYPLFSHLVVCIIIMAYKLVLVFQLRGMDTLPVGVNSFKFVLPHF